MYKKAFPFPEKRWLYLFVVFNIVQNERWSHQVFKPFLEIKNVVALKTDPMNKCHILFTGLLELS